MLFKTTVLLSRQGIYKLETKMFGYKDIKEFKEENGYDIENSWYPRVTKIVGIKNKPALHYFYASLSNYKEGEKIKKKSADEGTRLHEAVQSIMIGENPKFKEDIKPSVVAFKEYLQDKHIEVDSDSIEKRVAHHKYKYAGTVDAVAVIDGKIGILDIKTSQEIYRDYRLQTSAYVAVMKDEGKDIQTRWILRIDQHRLCKICGARLRSKGGRDKVRFDWNNPFMRSCKHVWGETVGEVELEEFPLWENDFEAFLGAKRLWEWENEDWLK
ncbi:MAG: hypothetical protein WD095_01575, partial [Candidatus Paceibacterota bacterium]